MAVSLYAVSLASRAAGSRRVGVRLSLLAAGVTAASGFLGGHLAIARKAGSRHPAFDESAQADGASVDA